MSNFFEGFSLHVLGHRWSHEAPFHWRFHAIHHSAEEVDFLVNTLAHPPINRIYASTLDWIFGTHHLPDDYGIMPKVPDSLTDQLFYPLMVDDPPQTKPEAG